MRLDGADNRPDTNQHLDAGEGIMSPPVRDLDDGPSKDGPLNYAPKKVRRPAPDQLLLTRIAKAMPLRRTRCRNRDNCPGNDRSDASHSSVMLRLWNCATSLHWHPTGFRSHRHRLRPA